MLGHQTYDQEVTGSIPGQGAAAYDDSGQVDRIHVPRRPTVLVTIWSRKMAQLSDSQVTPLSINQYYQLNVHYRRHHQPWFSLNNKLLNYNIYPLSDEAIRMRNEQHKDY